MIQNAFLIFIALAGIETAVLAVAAQKRFEKYFRFFPPVFWIYFIPILLGSCGFFAPQSSVYEMASAYVLPAALILLLAGVDLKAIAKLGETALGMFFAGSAGIIFTAPLLIFIFRPWLPENAWMGIGALSASWTGGSANMLAVKEAIQVPDVVFLPMVLVDTIVSYGWMAFLVAGAILREKYDRWNHSRNEGLDFLKNKTAGVVFKSSVSESIFKKMAVILCALGLAWLCRQLARYLPLTAGFSSGGWAILLASVAGLLLAATPLRTRLFGKASVSGYVLLYFMLTTIGARSTLSSAQAAPIMILFGICWVILHGIFLLIVGRIFKIPLALSATASQANIGGPASAPVVAEAYYPGLAPVGVLLGIFGNMIGTYLGLFCSRLCHWAWIVSSH